MKKKLISTILGTLFTTTLFAENSDYYAGASILGAETELPGESKYNTRYEIHFGYQINSSLSVEASYLDFGGFESNNNDSIESDAYSFSALYYYPIGHLNLIGKLGYLSQSSQISLVIPSNNDFDDTSGGVLFGAGIVYKLNSNLEVKTEFNISKSTNFGLVGLNFHF